MEPSSSRIVDIQPFDYLVAIACAANGSNTGVITMMTDSVFELHEVFGVSTEDDPADFHPNNFSVLITDSVSRQMSNIRVPQAIMTAPSNMGYRILRPVQFQPGANLTLDVLNLTANNNTITIALRGFKFFNAVG